MMLEAAGVALEVRPAHVDESVLPGEQPAAYVARVAAAKVAAFPDAEAVLAADTSVVLGDLILGKPTDAEDAAAMLRRLSGQTHAVLTGVSLRAGRRQATRVFTSRVRFRALSAHEITWYIGTGEPFDKAGAYGIQGLGAALVDRVHGSYSNVVGLPLRETLAWLQRWKLV